MIFLSKVFSNLSASYLFNGGGGGRSRQGYFKMWILNDFFFLSLPKMKYLNFEIAIGGLRIEIVILVRGGGG